MSDLVKSVNEAIRDNVLNHAHYLAGYENHEINELLKILRKAHDSLAAKLIATDGEYTSKWLASTLKSVDKLYMDTIEQMQGKLFGDLRSLGDYDIEWTTEMLKSSVPITSAWTSPAPTSVWSAITTSPADRGHVLSEIMDSFSVSTRDKITGAIRQGVIEGETIDQMIRRVRGSKALGYKDGILNQLEHGVETIVRTAVMHVSNIAQTEVYKQNAEVLKGLQWLATLDTRTCPVCGALDGTMVKVEETPIPPLHFSCRCVRVPITKSWKELGIEGAKEMPASVRASMTGDVPNAQTYGQWLKDQSVETQDKALGPKRAELFRGGVPIDRFVKDRTPMTLDEIMINENIVKSLNHSVRNLILPDETNTAFIDWLSTVSDRFELIENKNGIYVGSLSMGHEFESNLRTAEILRAKGWGKIYLLPNASDFGVQKIASPDALIDGKLFDFKALRTTNDNTIKSHFKKVKIQCGRTVLRYEGENFADFLTAVRHRANRSQSIFEVWVIAPDSKIIWVKK